MEAHTTLTHANCEINIYFDTDPVNPRTEWEHAGTMVCFHDRYNLGDPPYNDCPTYQCLLLDLAAQYLPESMQDGGFYEWARHNSLDDDLVEKLQGLVNQHYITLPLYLYDHSGITINTCGYSCPFDSGQVGIIYVSKARAVKEWGKKICTRKVRENAIRHMRSEVTKYDQYLTGDVHGFTVEHQESKDEESCWGFFGDNWCIKEAKLQAEYLDGAWKRSVIQTERDRQHELCTLIKNRVPLEIRQTKMAAWT